MVEKNSNRDSYFPAIEKKYGQPMSYWFAQMAEMVDTKYPELELVIAWNQPMLKIDGQYIFGVMVLKNHLLMAPWRTGAELILRQPPVVCIS